MPGAQIPVHPDRSPQLASHSGILVREDVAFANRQGVEKSGIRKRAEQTLTKLQEPLSKFLEPEEAVFYVTPAQIMPSGFEQFFLGWHAVFLGPAVLVLTNRRLLQLFVGRNGTWMRGVRSARWGDMEEAKVKGLLGYKLNIKYRDGKKEIFWKIRGDDGKAIGHVLEVILPASTGETSPALSMASYCPDCRSALIPGEYTCPQCHLQFRDAATAARRSWLIPGGGFFYIGHSGLGILHALTESVFIIVLVYWLLVALGIAHPEPTDGEAPPDAASAIIVVAFFVALLALEKWVMARVARKQVQNYIPVSGPARGA